MIAFDEIFWELPGQVPSGLSFMKIIVTLFLPTKMQMTKIKFNENTRQYCI
jgi:hypothetical protein